MVLPHSCHACDWPTWRHPAGSPTSPTRKCRTDLIFHGTLNLPSKTKGCTPAFPLLNSSVPLCGVSCLEQAIFALFRGEDVQGPATNFRGPQNRRIEGQLGFFSTCIGWAGLHHINPSAPAGQMCLSLALRDLLRHGLVYLPANLSIRSS